MDELVPTVLAFGFSLLSLVALTIVVIALAIVLIWLIVEDAVKHAYRFIKRTFALWR